MTSPGSPPLCPACRKPLDKSRLSGDTSTFGCSRCGRWFGRSELGGESAAGGPAQPQGRQDARVRGLAKNGVILELGTTGFEQAVDALVPKALQGMGEILARSPEIVRALHEGIRLSAIEFVQDSALIHHRVAGLAERRLALGISRAGIPYGPGGRDRAFVVLLSLMPEKEPGFEIPIWWRKRLCDRRAVYRLRKAFDVETIFQALQEP